MTANILLFASSNGEIVLDNVTFTGAVFVRNVIDGPLQYAEIKFTTNDSLIDVLPGNKLTVSDFENANNNGLNMHILDVQPDGLIVQVVERSSSLEDESGVTIEGDITTAGAAQKSLSISHNALGMTLKEKMSAAHFNWIILSLITLVQNALAVFSNISNWASELRIASKAELVRGFGWIYFDYENTEKAGEGVYVDDNNTGRGFLESAHPDLICSQLAAFVPEMLPPVFSSLTFASNTATVTVPGARVNDAVSLGPHPTYAGQATGRVSATDTVTIQSSGGSPNGDWSVVVTRPNSMPVISVRGLKIYTNLIGGAYANSAALESDLTINDNEAAFNLLVNSQQHRATIRRDAGIKALVQGSTTANAIMTATGGY